MMPDEFTLTRYNDAVAGPVFRYVPGGRDQALSKLPWKASDEDMLGRKIVGVKIYALIDGEPATDVLYSQEMSLEEAETIAAAHNGDYIKEM